MNSQQPATNITALPPGYVPSAQDVLVASYLSNGTVPITTALPLILPQQTPPPPTVPPGTTAADAARMIRTVTTALLQHHQGNIQYRQRLQIWVLPQFLRCTSHHEARSLIAVQMVQRCYVWHKARYVSPMFPSSSSSSASVSSSVPQQPRVQWLTLSPNLATQVVLQDLQRLATQQQQQQVFQMALQLSMAHNNNNPTTAVTATIVAQQPIVARALPLVVQEPPAPQQNVIDLTNNNNDDTAAAAGATNTAIPAQPSVVNVAPTVQPPQVQPKQQRNLIDLTTTNNNTADHNQTRPPRLRLTQVNNSNTTSAAINEQPHRPPAIPLQQENIPANRQQPQKRSSPALPKKRGRGRPKRSKNRRHGCSDDSTITIEGRNGSSSKTNGNDKPVSSSDIVMKQQLAAIVLGSSNHNNTITAKRSKTGKSDYCNAAAAPQNDDDECQEACEGECFDVFQHVNQVLDL